MTHDYVKLGFKCVLEIHQQLAGTKLFCGCPCEIRKDPPHFTVTRRLRASAGESGGVDQAAAHEQKKAKRFTYYAYYDTTCLVEIDEEPPHGVNRTALNICLQVCAFLHARINDQVQFMRKIVIDGSNTIGFQRTALVARDGWIELENGKRIRVPTICLEEEACQAIAREKDVDIYNLSRQGIPLIEIATAPDITTPEEAKEAAAKLGMILRSIEGMKRGIGTIRQDVNISIKDGARVELKGFQEFKSIPKAIENEIDRQLTLIKKGKTPEKEVRAVKEDFTSAFLRPMPGADRMYPETDVPIIAVDTQVSAGRTLDEREQELMQSYGIQKEWAKEILRRCITFDKHVHAYKNIPPAFIAETLVVTPKEIKARFKLDINPEDHLAAIFPLLDAGKIPKGAVFELLVEIAQGKTPDFSKYQSLSDTELEKTIIDVIKNNPGVSPQGIMGLVMAKVRGKADGKKVMELLKRQTA
jgi:Glu-tRNA(Gln) amidotransferase subunit E-like FAD-binding protein